MHYLDYITISIALALAVSLIAAYAFGILPLPPEVRPVPPRRREAAGGHGRWRFFTSHRVRVHTGTAALFLV